MESTRIEFKSDYNPDEIIRTICAFVNDIDNMGGGYIVVGVEEANGFPVLPAKGIEKNRIGGILKKLHSGTLFQVCGNPSALPRGGADCENINILQQIIPVYGIMTI